MSEPWLTTIGLEVHLQLLSPQKAFCACRPSPTAAPNTILCPVCLGLPGSMPTLSRSALVLALRAIIAMGLRPERVSAFDRKHYRYPDLAKGYQLTQDDAPLCRGGQVTFDGEPVRIERAHFEEDAARSIHSEAGRLLDFNRAGVPLLEVVTAPDFTSGAACVAWLKSLRLLMLHAGVCGARMELGQLRCDVNISVRRPGAALGTRVELKNINTFRGISKAIEVERRRQVEVLESGRSVARCTRRWDAERQTTEWLRGKVLGREYRFMREPDLPPLALDSAVLAEAQAAAVETPWAWRDRLIAAGASPEHAKALLETPERCRYLDLVIKVAAPKLAAQWLCGPARHWPAEGLPPARLAAVLQLLSSRQISDTAAKILLQHTEHELGEPDELALKLGLLRIDDEAALSPLVLAVLQEMPQQVKAFRAGKHALLGLFMGQAMARSGGAADPRRIRSLILRHLTGDDDD